MTARLAGLTLDNPRQRAPMAELSARMAAYFDGLDTTVALQRAGRGTAAQAMVRADTGRARIDHVLDTLGTIEAEERRLLRLRHAERTRQRAHRPLRPDAGRPRRAAAADGGAAGASALRNRRLVETAAEFERIAATDALTGLPNRRAFWAALQTEIARAGPFGRCAQPRIIDIDHFKRVNDRHGHPAGDTVLAAAADKMRAAVARRRRRRPHRRRGVRDPDARHRPPTARPWSANGCARRWNPGPSTSSARSASPSPSARALPC
jgi:GGDEF domain-containing protein